MSIGAPAITRRAAIAGGAAAGAIMLGGAGRRLPRIVSLNPCIDAVLVAIADRGQIAALSHYSRDPHGSTIADVARALPITYGSAEEVIALNPDLVLEAAISSPTTQAALARLGIATARFGVPETVADSLAQVRGIAAAIGQAQRGDALVARINAAIRTAAPAPGEARVSALVFMAGGFASGPGTLMDEMMRRAGLDNAMRGYGYTASRNVPLEQIIADPPRLLLSAASTPGMPSRAQRLVAHPALAGIAPRLKRAVFPERLLFCGGPVLIQTAQTLARARRAALA